MGKNTFEMLKDKDIGSIGIGAMIVFIAMVLVAGIAASVLVQTANNLQMQAMSTGRETIAEVSTSVAVLYIEGHVDSNNQIDQLALVIKPRAGSKDIDLNETVVTISDTTKKCVLLWNTSSFSSSVGTGGVFNESVFTNLTGSEFGIIVLEDADSSCNSTTPVINRGDCIILAVNTTNCFSGIDAREDVWGEIIPEWGAPGVYSFRVPASLYYPVIKLY
jgi:flagellin FlaB